MFSYIHQIRLYSFLPTCYWIRVTHGWSFDRALLSGHVDEVLIALHDDGNNISCNVKIILLLFNFLASLQLNNTCSVSFCLDVDGELYSGTAADFMGRDFAIFRTLGHHHPIRTEQHDSRWLNGRLDVQEHRAEHVTDCHWKDFLLRERTDTLDSVGC